MWYEMPLPPLDASGLVRERDRETVPNLSKIQLENCLKNYLLTMYENYYLYAKRNNYHTQPQRTYNKFVWIYTYMHWE